MEDSPKVLFNITEDCQILSKIRYGKAEDCQMLSKIRHGKTGDCQVLSKITDGGHGFDPGPRHTKGVKNGTSCSSLGTQTDGVELGLVDPVSG